MQHVLQAAPPPRVRGPILAADPVGKKLVDGTVLALQVNPRAYEISERLIPSGNHVRERQLDRLGLGYRNRILGVQQGVRRAALRGCYGRIEVCLLRRED